LIPLSLIRLRVLTSARREHLTRARLHFTRGLTRRLRSRRLLRDLRHLL